MTEIVGKVTRHLIEDEGCDPSTIYAYVGPSIESRNFEAMDDIINRVKKMSFDTSSFYTKKDETHYLLNSKGLIKQQLFYFTNKQCHCMRNFFNKFFRYNCICLLCDFISCTPMNIDT